MENKIDTTGMTVISNSDELIDYVVKQLKTNFDKEKEETPFAYPNTTIEDIKHYLTRNKANIDSQVLNCFFKKQNLEFANIEFKQNDYDLYLDDFNSIKFSNCKLSDCNFFNDDFFKHDVKIIFQNCIFDYALKTGKDLSSRTNDIFFFYCTFNERVIFQNEIKKEYKIVKYLFNYCVFKSDLYLENIIFDGVLIDNKDTNYIHELKIINCEFNDRFILNNLKANLVNIEKTVFHKKVELKDGEIEDIELIDTNFEKIFDSHGTVYNNFHCEKCIFKDFAAFEECEFGKKDSLFDPVKFKYSTFIDVVTFRKSKFHSGLDIDLINLRQDANFLKIDIEEEKTTRESFRIIKYSFDKVGNHIEANKYFAKEMRAYRRELFSNKNRGYIYKLIIKIINKLKEMTEPKDKISRQEKIVFLFNEIISNFGQSYLRPLFWILVTAIIYEILEYGYEQNWLYNIIPSDNESINFLIKHLNSMATKILPMHINGVDSGIAFLRVFFTVILGTLTWQLIVAVKRHTKR